eukprot:CAMPEP_0119408820 /NCGR_PEP_ID=MMETSP1335-20130426/2264_1 /TAXON_ID=259385 /ORGANISM="Chrysoculter rhomboideus, Strain RCC1486" /LENGTH=195 /DNA_ID=CAMNT_0007433105 /DNA_START=76 /DNA_END=661 /DNA_ORIENTATION=-
MSMANRPETYELVVLPDGVDKVTFEKDKKIENAGKFVVEKEDHTLGNIVRMQLLEDNRVYFAGYRMPHPLDHKIDIQVQTSADWTPAAAVIHACEKLNDKLNRLEEKFDAEVARKQHEMAAVNYELFSEHDNLNRPLELAQPPMRQEPVAGRPSVSVMQATRVATANGQSPTTPRPSPCTTPDLLESSVIFKGFK